MSRLLVSFGSPSTKCSTFVGDQSEIPSFIATSCGCIKHGRSCVRGRDRYAAGAPVRTGPPDSFGHRHLGAVCATSWALVLALASICDRGGCGSVYRPHSSGLSSFTSRRVTRGRGHQSLIGRLNGVDRRLFPEN